MPLCTQLFFLILLCFSPSVFAEDTPPSPSPTPLPQLGSDNFYYRVRLIKGKRKYHVIQTPEEKPSVENEKFTEVKVLANKIKLRRLIEELLIQNYLLQDGFAHDDSILLHEIDDGIIHISTNTEKELRVAMSRISDYEQATLQKTDPDVYTYKAIPPVLRSGDLRPTVLDHIRERRVRQYMAKYYGRIAPICSGVSFERMKSHECSRETVINSDMPEFCLEWQPFAKNYRYILTDDLFQEIQNQIGIKRGHVRVNYRGHAALKSIDRWKSQKNGELQDFEFVHYMMRQRVKTTKKEERIDIEEQDATVDYALTPDHEKELLEVIRNADFPPYQVLIEVKLLSVTRDTQSKLGLAFNANGKKGGFNLGALSQLLQNTPSSLSLDWSSASGNLVNLTIDALETEGMAIRHNLPDLLTLEHYKKNMEPISFVKKVVTPIQNITRDSISTKEVEVGLGVLIKDIKVIESDDYLRTYREFHRKFEDWLNSAFKGCRRTGYEGKTVREFIEMADNLFFVSDYTKIPLECLDKVLFQYERMKEYQRSIYNLLKINVTASLQDGGIVRTIQTPQSLNVEYEKIAYDFNLILNNRQPKFLGGTNQKENKRDKSRIPFISKIPFIGKFARSRDKQEKFDSVVAFLTVSVVDDRTEAYAAAKFSRLNQRFAIPKGLGGFAPDSAASPPLETGIRSNLYWMYTDWTAKGYPEQKAVLYEAKSKLPNGSPFGRKLISMQFYQRIFAPIVERGMTHQEDWSNFNLVRERIDHVDETFDYLTDSEVPGTGSCTAPTRRFISDPDPTQEECVIKGNVDTSHPFILTMYKIHCDTKRLTGEDFSLSEILAIARSEGVIGKGSNPKVADERILTYMAYLIAKHTGETDIFANQSELLDFEGNFLSRFEEKDNYQAAADFNTKIIEIRTNRLKENREKKPWYKFWKQ